MTNDIIAGIAAFFISIVSGISGGGGGIAVGPLLLLMGYPPQVVIATNKAAGVGVNIGALGKFVRQKKLIDWHWAVWLSVMALFASFIGTRLVFVASSQVLTDLIVAATLMLAAVLFFYHQKESQQPKISEGRKVLGIFLYFAIMTLQSGIGSGIGILLMFVLIEVLGFDALKANATKRVAGFVLVSTNFLLLAFTQYMDWGLALALGLGMLAGGYIGASLAVKKGSLLVKRALVVVSVIMAVSVVLRIGV